MVSWSGRFGFEHSGRPIDQWMVISVSRLLISGLCGAANTATAGARPLMPPQAVNRQALHRTVSGLSQIYDLFAIEDLQIAKLLRSAKGTAAEPGRIVQAKSGLIRASRSLTGRFSGRDGESYSDS